MTRITFTPGAAARIAAAVVAVENQRPAASPLSFERVDTPKRVFRMGTFTGSWSLGGQKVVTLLNSTRTVTASNLFAQVGDNTNTARACAIAKDGATWYLIAARC